MSAGTSVYAGGPYPISLVQIAVDGAGNTYAIGNWTVSQAADGTALTDIVISKTDPHGNLVYATYLGGKGADTAYGIAVDSTGNVYGVGRTTSIDFPVLHAVQNLPCGTAVVSSSVTGFVFRLDSSGNLSWSTYFGGTGYRSYVSAVAVDTAGNAYVTGSSAAPNLAVTAGAFQTDAHVSSSSTNPYDAVFVAKFTASGALAYSTWLGGGIGACSGVSTCLGYDGQGEGKAIAIDSSGNAFVAGFTNSNTLPVTTGAYQSSCNCTGLGGTFRASPFLVKLNAAGSALLYATYLGTDYRRGGPALAIDAAGNAYMAALLADSSSAASHGSLQILNAGGTALLSSAYSFPTASLGSPAGVAIEPGGNILMTGATTGGASVAVEMNHAGTAILNSVMLPAGLADGGAALDPGNGNLLLAGSSGYLLRLSGLSSAALPPLWGVGNAANLTVDSGVSINELVSIYGAGLGPATPITGQPVSGSYPTALGGVQVLFNNAPAPLIYVSATQINAAVPADYSYPATVAIQVKYNGATVANLTLPMVANAPGLFRNPDGTAAAVNQDGSLNTAQNPARAGSTITVWGTGVRVLSPYAAGWVSDSAVNFAGNGGFQVASAGGSSLAIRYAGSAPGMIDSAFQLNVQLPPVFYDGPTGTPFSLRISAGTAASPLVPLWVTN